jgi:hypothetical protein
MADNDHCFWHAPEHAEDAADARRLGGLRRRRERTVQSAYDLAGLATVPDIRRVLDLALLDTVALDNSVARNRLLVAIASTAARLLETGELEMRLAIVERALGSVPSSRSADPFADVDGPGEPGAAA